MKKLMLVLAIGAFAACNDGTDNSGTSADSATMAPADTSVMAPADTSAMAPADTTTVKDSAATK